MTDVLVSRALACSSATSSQHCYAAWRRSLSCRPIPQRVADGSRIEHPIDLSKALSVVARRGGFGGGRRSIAFGGGGAWPTSQPAFFARAPPGRARFTGRERRA